MYPTNQPDNQPWQRPSQTPMNPAHIVDKSAERVLAALAHGAIAFGLFGFTWLLSLGITGVIWLYSKRSPDVRFHAQQAGCYQCSVLLINVVWVSALGVGGGFSLFRIFQGQNIPEMNTGVALGACLFALWFMGSIAYGVIGAVAVLLGKRFKYPLLGDRAERTVL
jgi:uncharacterized Tic20 family protein